MVWVLLFGGLAVASLVVIGMLGWRVFGAAKALSRAARQSGLRINAVLPALERAAHDVEAGRRAHRHQPDTRG